MKGIAALVVTACMSWGCSDGSSLLAPNNRPNNGARPVITAAPNDEEESAEIFSGTTELTVFNVSVHVAQTAAKVEFRGYKGRNQTTVNYYWTDGDQTSGTTFLHSASEGEGRPLSGTAGHREFISNTLDGIPEQSSGCSYWGGSTHHEAWSRNSVGQVIGLMEANSVTASTSQHCVGGGGGSQSGGGGSGGSGYYVIVSYCWGYDQYDVQTGNYEYTVVEGCAQQSVWVAT